MNRTLKKYYGIFLFLNIIFYLFVINISADNTSIENNNIFDSNFTINNDLNNSRDIILANSIVKENKLTLEDIQKLKNVFGVFEEGVNYNIIIDEHGTGLIPPTEEQWNEMIGNVNIVNSIELSNNYNYPSSLDWSQTQFFPPIGNQASEGSCVCWAVGYYTKSFQEAEEHNWNLSGVSWTGSQPSSQRDKIFSPDFIYHQINGGVDEGAYYSDAMNLVSSIGACSWEKMPYSQYDHTSWPSEAAWREAPLYRGDTGYTYLMVNSSSGIDSLKNRLYLNGPVIIAIDAYFYPNLNSSDIWTLDTYTPSGTNHANTVVGYDDGISYIENGVTRYGAFKVANSWGTGWNGDHNNDGYYWISYEAMKQRVQFVMYMRDRIDYSPKYIAVFKISHSKREECNIGVGIGTIGGAGIYRTFAPWNLKGGAYPFPNNNIVFDVTDFYPDFYNRDIYLSVYDGGTTTTGTINSFSYEIYEGSYTPSGGSTKIKYATDTPINTSQGNTRYSIITNHAPNVPTIISPSNGAVNQLLNADIDWNCSDSDGDGLIYDVYFQASNSNPNLVASNISSSYYDPGALLLNTLYYWKIVASDGYTTTSSPVWNFRTRSNVAPTTPSNPIPSNGSTGQSFNTSLSWSSSDADGDPITYDIYLQANNSNPVLVASNQSGTTYNPGQLQPDTLYYWKIVAKDGFTQTTGPVWNFRTKTNVAPTQPSNPSPNNGSLGESTGVDLSWSCSDVDGDLLKYDVYLQKDNTNPSNKVGSDITTSYLDPGTLPKGHYYWKIVAKDTFTQTTSPVWDFWVNSAPSSPSITSIGGTDVNGSIIESTTPALVGTQASDPDGDTLEYRWLIWAGSGGSGPEGFNYKRDLSITNSGQALADYQVKLTFTSSNFDFTKVKQDGSDIRFYSGDTKLPYYLESWDSLAQSATVWVKVTSLPQGSSTVTMYYGNAAAASESSGDSVFIFFDDFPGTSLDTNKWQTNVVGSITSQVNNYFRFTGASASGGTYWIYGNTNTGSQHQAKKDGSAMPLPATPYVVEWTNVAGSTGDMGQCGVALVSSDNRVRAYLNHADGTGNTAYSPFLQGFVESTKWSGPTVSKGDERDFRFVVDGTSVKAYEKAHSSGTWTLRINGTSSAKQKLALTAGAYGGYAFAPVDVRNLVVRSYAATEPTVTVGPEGGIMVVSYDSGWVPAAEINRTASELPDKTTFFATLSAKDPAGATASSSIFKFRVQPPNRPPISPTITSIGTATSSGETIDDTTPDLKGYGNGDPDEDELEFRWLIDNDSDFSSPVYDSGWLTNSADINSTCTTTLNDETTYYSKLTAKDPWGLESSQNFTFNIHINDPPTSPSITSIGGTDVNGSIIESTTPALVGTQASDPDGDTLEYRWLIWAGSGGSGPEGFNYKRDLSITNSGQALADYQVKLTFTSSNFDFTKVKQDGSDIRFYSGDTKLPYYLESWDSLAQSATVWVKVTSLPQGSSTVTMYYGNAAAASESSGDSVFIFFDDFPGTSLDTNKWQTNVVGSITSQVNNYFRFTGASASGGTYWIYGNTNTGSQHQAKKDGSAMPLPATPYVVEWTNVAGSTGDMGQCGVALVSSDNRVRAYLNHADGTGNTAYSPFLQGFVESTKWSGPTVSKGDERDFRFVVDGTSVKAYEKAHSSGTWTLRINGTSSAKQKLALTAGAYGGYAFAPVDVRNLVVRSYAATEPTVTVGPEGGIMVVSYDSGWVPAAEINRTASELPDKTTFFATLSAKDPAGATASSSIFKFRVQPPNRPPISPTITSIGTATSSGETIDDTTPDLKGYGNGDPDEDELEFRWLIDNDSDFSSPVYDSGWLTNSADINSTCTTTLNDETTYYSKLTAKDPWGLESSQNFTFNIHINDPPTSPSITSIGGTDVNGSIIESTTPALVGTQASDPDGDTLEYRWLIWAGSGGSGPEGFNYKRDLSITNSGQALADYQVKLTFTSSNFDFTKVKQDGSDIRFYSGDTKLPYYLESWDSLAQSATVWVKVTSLPQGSSTVTMYYGNAAAASESSGDSVFIFFDDFPGTSLDTNKWQTNVVGSITSQVNNYFRFTGASASGGTYWIYGNTNTGSQHQAKKDGSAMPLPATPYVVEWTNVAGSTGDMGQCGVALVSSDNRVRAYLNHADGTGNTAYSPFLQGFVESTKWSGPTVSKGDERDFRFVVDGTSVKAYEKAHSSGTWTLRINGTSSAKQKLALTAGAYGGYAFAPVDVRNLVVRSYAATEPTVTVGPEGGIMVVSYDSGWVPAAEINRTASELPDKTTFFATLSAKDPAGATASSSIFKFRVQPPNRPPISPTITSIGTATSSGETIDDTTPDLKGYGNGDPDEDELEFRWLIDNDSDFSSPVYDSGWLTNSADINSTCTTTLNDETTYYSKLTAKDPWGLESSQNFTFNIHINDPPTSPSITSIGGTDVNGSIIESTTPALVGTQASDPDGDTLEYRWLIWAGSGGSGPEGFNYKRDLSITNSGQALADYQVKLTFTSSNFDFTKVKQDGSDIRFYSGDTKLPYYLESWDSLAQSATVWVKVTSLPQGSSTVTMYYGNAAAASESSGDSVFIFFDDFPGTSLDTNKWQTNVVGSITSQVNNYFRFTGASASGGTYWIYGNTNTGSQHQAKKDGSAMPLPATPYVVEWTNVAGSTGDMGQCGVALVSSDNRVRAYLNHADGTGNTAYSPFLQGFVESTKWSGPTVSKGDERDFRFVVDGTSVKAYEKAHSSGTWTLRINGTSSAKQKLALTAGAYGGYAFAPVDVRNLVVRSYAATEPTVTVGPEGGIMVVSYDSGWVPAAEINRTASELPDKTTFFATLSAKDPAGATASSSVFKFMTETPVGANTIQMDLGIIRPIITSISGEGNNSKIFTRNPEFKGYYSNENTESIRFEWIIDDNPLFDSLEYSSDWIVIKEINNSAPDLSLGKFYVKLNSKDSSNIIISSDIMSFTILNNPPEIKENFDETGVKSGDIEIPFTLYDFDEEDCNVSVEYFHLGEWRKATIYNSDISAVTLRGSKTGTNYSVVWNSSADLGKETVNELLIMINVTDGVEETYIQTKLFTVDNTQNVPRVTLQFDEQGRKTGIVNISYMLYEEESLKCSIQVEYYHLGVWRKASEALNSEGTSNLISGPEGIQHIFAWDTTSDVGKEVWKDTKIRIKSSNGIKDGIWAETSTFAVGNNNPPEIKENFDETGVKSGDIEIPFTLYDFDEEDCNVSVEYFHLGEWRKATIYNSDISAVTLRGSKTGTNYSVVWNSSADTSQKTWSDAKIRLIAADGKDINSIETGSFNLDNTNSLTLEILLDKNGKKSNTVLMPYILYSLDESKCSIQVEYYHLGVWRKASEALNSEGTSNLISGPEGIQHIFAWDSIKDSGEETWFDVKIRIKPSNDITEGSWIQTETFIVSNNPTNIEETFDSVVQYRLNKAGELIVAVEQEYPSKIPLDIQAKLNEAQVFIYNALKSGENVYAAQQLQEAILILESIHS